MTHHHRLHPLQRRRQRIPQRRERPPEASLPGDGRVIGPLGGLALQLVVLPQPHRLGCFPGLAGWAACGLAAETLAARLPPAAPHPRSPASADRAAPAGHGRAALHPRGGAFYTVCFHSQWGALKSVCSGCWALAEGSSRQPSSLSQSLIQSWRFCCPSEGGGGGSTPLFWGSGPWRVDGQLGRFETSRRRSHD